MDNPHQLKLALADAVHICWETVDNKEEHGGVILHHPKTEAYGFVFLRNHNTGTKIAPFLWTADRNEYAKHILPMFKEGWKQYASFHTHPEFTFNPSEEDLNVLFPGFENNYIFSGLNKNIAKFYWVDTANMGKQLAGKVIEL